MARAETTVVGKPVLTAVQLVPLLVERKTPSSVPAKRFVPEMARAETTVVGKPVWIHWAGNGFANMNIEDSTKRNRQMFFMWFYFREILKAIATNVHQNNAALLRAKHDSFPASKSVERLQ